MGILNLVIPLLLNIFSIFVSSVLYVALKILIDRFCVCVCVWYNLFGSQDCFL